MAWQRVVAWISRDATYGAYLEAVTLLESIDRRRAAHDRELLRAADACERAGDPARAAEAYLETARRAARSENVEKEVALLLRALLQAPSNIVTRLNLAGALEHLGRNQEAAAHYATVADAFSHESPFDAFNLLRHALDLDPQLSSARLKRNELVLSQVCLPIDPTAAASEPASEEATTIPILTQPAVLPVELFANDGSTARYSANELDHLLSKVEELGSVTLVFDDLPFLDRG